jgi:signal transduction histidine kinase
MGAKDKDQNQEDLIEQKVIERMSHISSELTHDLRSPLQTIQNAIYLLQKNPDNEQLYTMVRQSLNQATQILDNFRDYYKAHIIQRIEVDPRKVVDLALSELEIPENVIVNKKIAQVVPFSMDPSKIALAISKLLLNAIEAMPEGGKLDIGVFEEGDILKITVADTGVGISSEVSDIMYTPFISNHKIGKGLGLPTAKRVVESHGGQLAFFSEVGVGTVFTITLPSNAVDS